MLGTELTLVDVLEAHARTMPHAFALRGHPSGAERTWRQLATGVGSLARDLRRRGVGPGDVIACLTRNRIWAFEAILATMRLGGVAAPLSPLLTPDMLGRLLSDSGAKLLLVDPPLSPLAEAAAQAAGGAAVVAAGPQDDDRAIVVAAAPNGEGSGGPSAARPEAPCSLIYSSGATGAPKGIVHSHRARMALAASLALGFRLGPSSVTALATPPFTNGTWMTWLPSLLVGAACIVLEDPKPDAFEAAAKVYGATHVFMVPTQYQALLARCDPGSFALMEAFISAGAPMPGIMKQTFRQRFGARLFELWGLTEGLGVVISPQEMKDRPFSVGRPAGGCVLRLIDEDGQDVTGQGVGEIVGRSTSMMDGYWKRPDLDAAATWVDEHGARYLRSGDFGEMDADGYLRIRGRKKEMIISGGLNVYPVDIEDLLCREPGVIAAAVIGQPHDKWGETPVAFVYASPEAGIKAADLQERVNRALAKHQRLAALHVQTHDLPRNALGKVLKHKLAELLPVPGDE